MPPDDARPMTTDALIERLTALRRRAWPLDVDLSSIDDAIAAIRSANARPITPDAESLIAGLERMRTDKMLQNWPEGMATTLLALRFIRTHARVAAAAAEPPRPLAVGDVVRLASGGPAMTIASIYEAAAEVIWFEENLLTVHRDQFPTAALVAVSKEL